MIGTPYVLRKINRVKTKKGSMQAPPISIILPVLKYKTYKFELCESEIIDKCSLFGCV
jgi:hypothetical protein